MRLHTLAQVRIAFACVCTVSFTSFFVLLMITINLIAKHGEKCYQCCIRRGELLAIPRVAEYAFDKDASLLISQMFDGNDAVKIKNNTFDFFHRITFFR